MILPLAVITSLIGMISYKFYVQQKTIETVYTPFDYITGQTSTEFHEEKEEKEENQDNGDDKDKGL
ncbi:DUF3951 domain-containing protein [Shimazuella sp. AN120528]|uniref:DUF3951 domain-containing protein n=1 Tax=Shimazuella soli TaxID=1892854 RepID=UPI001F0DA20F|nr:DUF3951 domain-containing protein [Shimazuella soli]MCH5584620.1 DUF3951 domain-containing protein [Shimazuella soli]